VIIKKVSDNQKQSDVQKSNDNEYYQITHEVPLGMIVPAYETVYKIIKRTADFYQQVGKDRFNKLQSAQSSNPSFSFLNKNDTLYPYFKFLTYPATQQQQKIFLKRLEEEKRKSEWEQERARFIQTIKIKEQESVLAVPPREICFLVEKVSVAVVEFGRGLEDKLKTYKDTKEDPLFSFLKTGNIYRPFYELRLKEATERKMNEIRIGREKKYYDEEKIKIKEEKRKHTEILKKFDENKILMEELHKMDETEKKTLEDNKKAMRLEKAKAGLSLLLQKDSQSVITNTKKISSSDKSDTESSSSLKSKKRKYSHRSSQHRHSRHNSSSSSTERHRHRKSKYDSDTDVDNRKKKKIIIKR